METKCNREKCPYRIFQKIIDSGFHHFTAHKVEFADETVVSFVIKIVDGKGDEKEVTIKL
jgi:hypothetical protein